MTEADTCRKFVVPWLQAAGWDTPPHLINEQRTFTDGRIIFTGGKARRGRQKRADYLLRYRPDFPIAVVEAKASYRQAGEGLQQAKEYAEILGLQFAYATNGADIIEFDYTTGIERTVAGFPEPDELWRRLRDAEGIDDDAVAEKLLTPTLPDRARPLRYYQEIAVNRASQALLQGRRRILLTLCTESIATIELLADPIEHEEFTNFEWDLPTGPDGTGDITNDRAVELANFVGECCPGLRTVEVRTVLADGSRFVVGESESGYKRLDLSARPRRSNVRVVSGVVAAISRQVAAFSWTELIREQGTILVTHRQLSARVMIRYVTGDLLAADGEALVNIVDCVGVMGGHGPRRRARVQAQVPR